MSNTALRCPRPARTNSEDATLDTVGDGAPAPESLLDAIPELCLDTADGGMTPILRRTGSLISRSSDGVSELRTPGGPMAPEAGSGTVGLGRSAWTLWARVLCSRSIDILK
jgi:hypothetical protein